MHYIFAFLFLAFAFCFANDPFLQDTPPELPFSTGNQRIGGLVNPKNGQLSLSATDLIASGVEPLAITRHYYPPLVQEMYDDNEKKDEHHLCLALNRQHGWIFFPHLVAIWQDKQIIITEPDGSMLEFKRHRRGEITLESVGPFTNSDGQTISCTYDSRNTHCLVENGKLIVHSKDGSIRYYERILPLGSPTYHLKEERLPNGRWILYSYNEQYTLISIQSTSPDKQHTYATLSRFKNGWITGTGEQVQYQFEALDKRDSWFKWWPLSGGGYAFRFFCLKSVSSPISNESYNHTPRHLLYSNQERFSSTYTQAFDNLRITDIELPVGPNGQNIITHSITYSPQSETQSQATAVLNPDGTSTIYKFSKDGFLSFLQHQRQKTLYHWSIGGRLMGIEIQGLYKKEFLSDRLGNPIQETFIGDDTYTIRREYEGPLLVKEEADAVTTYTYLPETNLITSKITDGREEYYTYDEHHNLVETVIGERRTCYELYQEGPHLHRIEWIVKEDRQIHLHYDEQGHICQEDHHDGDGLFVYTIYREHNERGNVVSETNALGQKTLYTYDQDGRLTSASRPQEKREYDKRGRLKKQSDALHTTTYKYDMADQLIEKTDRFGSTRYTYQNGHIIRTRHGDSITTSSYDIYGREVERTDANGHTTHFQYNARGQPIRIEYPDGTWESSSYYPNGNLKEHTDPDGNTIAYAYDSLGRVLSKVYEGIGEEIFTYDPLHLLSSTDLEGYTTAYSYDALGRKTEEERCGRVTAYTYDSLSRLASVTKGGITTSYQYDLLDRLIEETTPYSRIAYTYDEEGNKSSITTGDAAETFAYDPLKRLIRQTDPLGNTTTIEYTDFEKIITDPNGTSTIETYDIYEHLISKEIRNVMAFRYTYDLAGNLIHQEEDVYKNGVYLKTLTTDYTYTPTNKLASITKGDETTYYDYFPSGKIKTKPDGTIVEYTYDFLGSVLSAGSDTFCYNKLGHLISGTGFTRTVDPFGNILQETFSNGLTIEKTYDDLGRPLTMKLPTGDVFYTYDLRLKTVSYKDYTHEYTYDSAGHVLQSGLTTYTRDAKGQITGLTAPYLSEECRYDPLGNLTFATPNSYSYDELSQLTHDFDSHFDLQDAPDTGNLPSINGLALTYDEHDRLIQAGPTHFTYDALGRRLSKGNELYLYDGLEEVGTASSTKIGNILLDLDGTLAIPLFDATYTLRYLIAPEDHTILASYQFDPFGTPLAISESLDNPYRYAFKHYDKETTLIYFGKRYYNPATRRWITPDPLGPIDTVNLYAFVRNNPFRYTDYTGLFSSSIISAPSYEQSLWRMDHPIEFSSLYAEGQKELKSGKIIFVNGIDTTLAEARQHSQMLSNYAGGARIDGLHNQTHSWPVDGLECVMASMRMPSYPSLLLHMELREFHRTRGPEEKMFLLSTSGGAIQVKNALLMSSKAMRNRVESLAISPAAIIPKKLCFSSHNYASKHDPIPLFAILQDPLHAHEMTFLPPHPNAPLFDHSISSPTFTKVLEDRLDNYIQRSGGFK